MSSYRNTSPIWALKSTIFPFLSTMHIGIGMLSINFLFNFTVLIFLISLLRDLPRSLPLRALISLSPFCGTFTFFLLFIENLFPRFRLFPVSQAYRRIISFFWKNTNSARPRCQVLWSFPGIKSEWTSDFEKYKLGKITKLKFIESKKSIDKELEIKRWKSAWILQLLLISLPIYDKMNSK